jgi:hypothetical protein
MKDNLENLTNLYHLTIVQDDLKHVQPNRPWEPGYQNTYGFEIYRSLMCLYFLASYMSDISEPKKH